MDGFLVQLKAYPSHPRLQVSTLIGTSPYVIGVEILSFEATPDDQVQLQARWALRDQPSEDADVIRLSRIVTPISGADYRTIVSAMNGAFAELCREIADAILDREKDRANARP